MNKNFEQVFNRLSIIDRDLTELDKLKEEISVDRPFINNITQSFEKNIDLLKSEKSKLLELTVKNPPEWVISEIKKIKNSNEIEMPRKNKIADLTVPKPIKSDVMKFLRTLPKIELHLHLEACINKETLKAIRKKNNLVISEEEFENKFKINSLSKFIELFLFIQSSIKTVDDFSYMVSSLAQYLRSNHIVYAEVFFAPSKFRQNGLDFHEMMKILIDKIREIKKEDGTEIKILIDVSRTFGKENAMQNLELALTLNYEEVIGIGLGGAELNGPAKDYEEVFKLAEEKGFRRVVHAGEDDGPWSIWDAINCLHAERIGHGVSAIQDPELVEYLKVHQIPIEICLTSNIFTAKYVKTEKKHPVRYYYNQGLLTCINTDDPEILSIDLTLEYYKLYHDLKFSFDEIFDLLKKGVTASFHPNKDSLWKKMNSEIQDIKKKYNLK